jgi:hypothetical protein
MRCNDMTDCQLKVDGVRFCVLLGWIALAMLSSFSCGKPAPQVPTAEEAAKEPPLPAPAKGKEGSLATPDL